MSQVAAPSARERESCLWSGCKLHDFHHCNAEAFGVVPRTIAHVAKGLQSIAYTGTAKDIRDILKDTVVSKCGQNRGGYNPNGGLRNLANWTRPLQCSSVQLFLCICLLPLLIS